MSSYNPEPIGSTSPGPVFPRKGQQWFECYICGFDYPLGEHRRHYRSHRMVCLHCDDQPTHTDYLSEIVAPREKPVITEQPVSCQGEMIPSYWYEGEWYDAEWYRDETDCSGGSK